MSPGHLAGSRWSQQWDMVLPSWGRGPRGGGWESLRKEKALGLHFANQAHVVAALKSLKVLCLSSHKSFLGWATSVPRSLLSLLFISHSFLMYSSLSPQTLLILFLPSTPADTSALILLGNCGFLTSCSKGHIWDYGLIYLTTQMMILFSES